MPRVRVACCQLDVVVGDLDGNVARVLAAYQQAEAAGADLAVFGELTLTGYPPEDLLLKPGFVRASHEALSKVAAGTGRCVAVVGFVEAGQDQPVFIFRIFEQQRSRRAMIALFLAVLEMVRMQAVVLTQKDLFGEIALQRHGSFDSVFASDEPMAAIEEDYI